MGMFEGNFVAGTTLSTQVGIILTPSGSTLAKQLAPLYPLSLSPLCHQVASHAGFLKMSQLSGPLTEFTVRLGSSTQKRRMFGEM